MQARWHKREIAQSTETAVVDGQVNKDAAWYYPEPKAAASEIAGRIAFWKGVAVTPP